MSDTPSGQFDRRAYPRYDASMPTELEVQGDESGNGQITGQAINVSRGGMLAFVDHRIENHSRCMVRLFEAKDRVSPETKWGKVRRVQATTLGSIVAIEWLRWVA